MTAAVILAAGASSRLGYPKQFLEFQGKALIQRAVEAASPCWPVIVVAGRDFVAMSDLLKNTRAIVVENPEWEAGKGSSIRIGLAKALEHSASLAGVVMMLCDQPFVTQERIAELIELKADFGCAIVASRYQGTLGVPALFDRSLFPQLRKIADETGARELIRANVGRVIACDFPDGGIDIDTEADAAIYQMTPQDLARSK